MKRIKRIVSLLLILICSFSFNVPAFAFEGDVAISTEKTIVIAFNDNVELKLNINIIESKSGEFVYANAHGNFYYTGTTTAISQYGMDVTFQVIGNTSNVSNGGNISAYHNSSDSNYTALEETKMSGEETANCSATGTFTLVSSSNKKYPASITLKLSIESNGKKTMHVSGSYEQWDVDSVN